MSHLLEHVQQSIQSRQLFRRGQSILVAVSGGVDSMVLLRLLHDLAERHRWRLRVAHMNHRLRGRSSDADEGLVRKTAQKLGLPVIIERAEVRQIARAHKLSIEMAARNVRHEFLARTAARLRCPSIALAHHADDQLELFFLRLLRGSGGEGLAGMKWRSPSPINPEIELVRPLLDLPKSVLAEFAAGMEVRFRNDATNASLEIQRNRIRHELLPLLREKYQPALDKSLLRLMEIVGAEAEFVTQAATAWLKQEGKTGQSAPGSFSDLSPAVQRRCLQMQLLRQGVTVDFDLVEELRLNTDKPVSVRIGDKAGVIGRSLALPSERRTPALRKPIGMTQQSWISALRGQVVVRDEKGILHLRLPEAAAGFESASVEVCLKGRAGEAAFGGAKINWRILTSGRKSVLRPEAGREFFDARSVGLRVLLRHWQPGDRFQPIGMAAPVKLQDLFTNEKILRNRRHELIVATTAQGEVFWVEGLRISERFKLTNSTKRRLLWRWQRL